IVNPLRIKDWVLAELEASLLLYFTGVSRESARIIDEQARNARAGASDSLEAMHQLKAEAVQMKENLLQGDLAGFARTLQQGWQAKKRMASSISNPMIDALEALAMDNGARATKVSGAGGGGFMMFVCDPVDRMRLSAALRAQGGSLLDFHFSPGGATAWRVP
ncbi:MAG TPA: dehydrogenase, partial [Thermomonas sp.]|nr:dehydrogenase [Thermomonas sp.]